MLYLFWRVVQEIPIMPEPLLSTQDLSVYRLSAGEKRALLEDVSMTIHQGQIVALVGESGSGKTTLAHAITGLFPRGTQMAIEGRVEVEGRELAFSDPHALRRWRGKIRYVFQEPWLALNPLSRVRSQFRFAMNAAGFSKEGDPYAIQLLAQVGIDDGVGVLNAFPHQLSGGLAQRVMIALALLSSPKLLIADEPTSSLDAIHRFQILDLLRSLKEKQGLTILLVTHDLEIARRYADEVAVLYAGRIREIGPAADFFRTPLHPYSQALVQWSVMRPSGNMEVVESSLGTEGAASILGCRFHIQCPKVQDDCLEREPRLEQIDRVRQVRCLYWES
jgi:oligopeptide/dipeptide ABC transporter ATP-binding protein